MIVENRYGDSFILGTLLMAATYIIALAAGWIDTNSLTFLSYVEIAAVWTSYICTILCVRLSAWNYPIGIVTTALYSYLFYMWELPAVALFNAYLVLSLCYGWYFWGNDSNPKSVITRIKGMEWFIYPIFGLGLYVLLLIINGYYNFEMKSVDIIVAVLSGVAQLALDRKKLESWAIWACVNLFSIYLYYNQELYLVTIQYVAFLINCGIGYWAWKKSYGLTNNVIDSDSKTW